jgi:hypothetical protein
LLFFVPVMAVNFEVVKFSWLVGCENGGVFSVLKASARN